MARQPLVARRAEELLGTAVVATSPVAGGDIATATRLRLSSGQTALMKTLPHAPEGFFEAEAATPGLGAECREEVTQWLRSSRAGSARGIGGPQICNKLIAKVMDWCGFHDDASTQSWPPVVEPGGHCWCNEIGSA